MFSREWMMKEKAKMLAERKGNDGPGNNPPSLNIPPGIGKKIEQFLFSIRGCTATEAASWRAYTPPGDPPSQNNLNKGTTYVLEEPIYNDVWLNKLTNTINKLKEFKNEQVVLLRDTGGMGSADYPGLLNKKPVMDGAYWAGDWDLNAQSTNAIVAGIISVISAAK